MYVTCYICHVGALSKAEDILVWNMELVLTYARILFQQNETRCAYTLKIYLNHQYGRETNEKYRKYQFQLSALCVTMDVVQGLEFVCAKTDGRAALVINVFHP